MVATRLENLTRYYALLLGLALALAGVNGFVPFFTPPAPADAPHLHYAIYAEGGPRNPYPLLVSGTAAGEAESPGVPAP